MVRRVVSLESSRFRCCCGCCHVKNLVAQHLFFDQVGCVILAVVEVILVALYIANEGVKLGVLADQVQDKALPSVIVGSILFVLLVIAIVLMVVGLCLESAPFLIPHLIVQALYIIVLIVGFVLAIVFLIINAINRNSNSNVNNPFATNRDRQDFANLQNTLNRNNVNPDYAYLITGIVVIVFFFIMFCLECWFFSIVYRCYQYFKLKTAIKKATKTHPAGSHAQYTAQTHTAQVHPQPIYYGGQHYQEDKTRRTYY